MFNKHRDVPEISLALVTARRNGPKTAGTRSFSDLARSRQTRCHQLRCRIPISFPCWWAGTLAPGGRVTAPPASRYGLGARAQRILDPASVRGYQREGM